MTEPLHRVLGKDYDFSEVQQSAINWEVHLPEHKIVAMEFYADDKSHALVVSRSFLDINKIDVEEYRKQARKRGFNTQYGFYKVRINLDDLLSVVKSSHFECTETHINLSYFGDKSINRLYWLQTDGRSFFLSVERSKTLILDTLSLKIQQFFETDRQNEDVKMNLIKYTLASSQDFLVQRDLLGSFFLKHKDDVKNFGDLFAEQLGYSSFHSSSKKYQVVFSDYWRHENGLLVSYTLKFNLFKEEKPVPFTIKVEGKDGKTEDVLNENHDKVTVELLKFMLKGT